MKRRDEKGRVINPFSLFSKACERALLAVTEYMDAVDLSVQSKALRADAVNIASVLNEHVDAVITSPPYHNAVDYYRRHQLEMYWLGLTLSHQERLSLLPQYIGRPRVPSSHTYVRVEDLVSLEVRRVETEMRQISPERANAFKHYCVAMHRVLQQLACLLREGTPAIFVVGHSTWNGTELNTTSLFTQLAKPHFELAEQLWYPVKNRYMSYSRRNGASIDREFVLVLRRTNVA